MVELFHHRPRKRFGQNFLVDPRITDKIVAAVNPKPDDALVEIGPGKGVLTKKLLQHVDRLDVIEIDRDLAAHLERELNQNGRLTVHCVDALEYNFNRLHTQSPLRIVGNLPYNISTPLMFHLFDFSNRIADMHFMLQKEVVDRLAAAPGSGDYGRLSVMVQYYAAVTPLFAVAPSAFKPIPKVDSAVVRLARKPASAPRANNERTFSSVVKQSFAQRRKTLKNNLKGILTGDDLAACGIDPGARAETLSVDAFIRLADRAAVQSE